MTKLKLVLFAAFMFFSPLAFGGELNVNAESLTRNHRLNPCTSWRYMNFNTGAGYICTFRGMSVTVPDAYDLDNVIRNLLTKIDGLEQRVAQLEGRESK